MFSGRITQATLRVLDWLADTRLPPEKTPAHQRTGRRGEEAAYFHLQKIGLHDGGAKFPIAALPGRD